MKQTVLLQSLSLLIATIFLLGISIPAFAHDGEDHHAAEKEEKVLSIDEMQQVISLMQQIIVLLTSLRALPPPAIQAMPVIGGHEGVTEMEEHHEHMHDEAAESTEAELVIEVETHHDQTHVHVRYVDKPEDMFFVDANINDENALISAISAHTGLSADEIKAALKYY
jgi:hypothetical protein